MKLPFKGSEFQVQRFRRQEFEVGIGNAKVGIQNPASSIQYLSSSI
jgi:hypothetical protein